MSKTQKIFKLYFSKKVRIQLLYLGFGGSETTFEGYPASL
jgi:hypothetical protein